MPSELSELIADVKEQVLYLQELGVESLAVDLPEEASPRSKVQSPKSQVSGIPAPIRAASVTPAQSQTSGSRLSSLPSLSGRTAPFPPVGRALKDDSDEQDVGNAPLQMVAAPVRKDESLFGEIGPTLPDSGETIESIRAEIGNCTRCPLYTGRKQVVHSSGNFNADLMFVGEAPGADEDEQGFPFVGRAGQLLTKIIESIGLKRDDVFIGNINRCRPPANRQPTLPEAETCRPFLHREIAVVRPKVIVVMGNTATQNLLNTKIGITKLRGSFQDYLGAKLMPTFHPAYLLRDPHKKREVWEDMKKVRDALEL